MKSVCNAGPLLCSHVLFICQVIHLVFAEYGVSQHEIMENM